MDGAPIDDVLDERVRLLLVGINPGTTSSARNQHFARAGNRFWPALNASGLVDGTLAPDSQHRLPSFGIGITNLVARGSPRAADVTREELRAGGQRLAALVAQRDIPGVVILGVTAYRAAFDDPTAQRGALPARPGWWLADNPSGLNAHATVAGLAASLAAAGAAVGLPDLAVRCG